MSPSKGSLDLNNKFASLFALVLFSTLDISGLRGDDHPSVGSYSLHSCQLGWRFPWVKDWI